MHKVKIVKVLWSQEEDEVKRIVGSPGKTGFTSHLSSSMYCFNIEVGFVPFLGLSISSGKFVSGKIEQISWDNDECTFICRVADEYPHQALDTYIDHSFLEKVLRIQGWQPID